MGYWWCWATLVTFCCIEAVLNQIIHDEDICGLRNGRRLYLELGAKGILSADNVTFVKNSAQQDGPRPYATANSSHDQCSLELVTCPSCVISLVFKSIDLDNHCGDGGMTIDSPCRCDYVWISEPPYEDVSGSPYCGHYSPITYRSNTRTVSIALLFSRFHSHAFSIEYTAERNRLLLTGEASTNEMTGSTNHTDGGILTSPFFPSRYPRDLGMEYIITCPSKAPSCRIRVLFSDFQLASVSVMEFYDWNGQRIEVISGTRFRPPVISSTGPSLLIRFYANGGTGLGYKAFYSFALVDFDESTNQPITDCGGYVDNQGGTITMMDMVEEGIKNYDCVWIIKPPKSFVHLRTHMYLKVITFAEMAGNTELIIKEGPTSALKPLEILRHPVSQLQPPRLREHITTVSNGFHISLRGSFGPSSRLAIAYSAFTYIDCYSGSDFLCQNHRCISNLLSCDGFDHCGDSSDEPATCIHNMDVPSEERKWHQSKANYFFPRPEHYPDLKTATLVFAVGSLGLICMISTLMIMLYRIGSRARQQRALQSRLRTISELLDGSRIDELSMTDDQPPIYEAPPNYDEVIKLGMEDETRAANGRKKQRSPRNPTQGRSIPPSQCSCEFESQLIINSCGSPTNGNLRSDPPNFPNNNSENTSSSETPPPPYVTPPETAVRRANCAINQTGRETILPSDPGIAEPSTSAISPSRFTVCRGSCSTSRRNRFHNQGGSSTSLPISRDVSASPTTDRSAAVNDLSNEPATERADPNALGAYEDCLYVYSKSTSSSNYQSPSQLDRSNARFVYTSTGFDDTCDNAQGVTSLLLERNSQDEKLKSLNRQSCSCEGACGCASNHATDEISNKESPTSVKDRVMKLLRSSSNCKYATSLSTDHSTLNENIGSSHYQRDVATSRSTSTEPRDRKRARVYNSYERIQDQWDVADETTSFLGSSTVSIRSAMPFTRIPLAATRNYSSCDLNSLYESIRILDDFLAKRTISSDTLGDIKKRKQMKIRLFDEDKQKSDDEEAAYCTPMSMSRRES